jgi:hypothetical protein
MFESFKYRNTITLNYVLYIHLNAQTKSVTEDGAGQAPTNISFSDIFMGGICESQKSVNPNCRLLAYVSLPLWLPRSVLTATLLLHPYVLIYNVQFLASYCRADENML